VKDIDRILIKASEKIPSPSLNDDLPFGKIHSNHMVLADFLAARGGWQKPKLEPFSPFAFYPDSVVFHYGQQIFEGLKAYRLASTNQLALFRPDLNARRFFHSAERLGMEPVPFDLFQLAIAELVRADEDFLLPYPGCLYVRPCLIPLDRGVSYRASEDYRFFVMACAVKSYFSGHNAASVLVEDELVRSVPGGTGDIKAGANYAQAASSLRRAKELGADSVLWLDALEHRYVEEIGAMNIMFVYDKYIVTPPLSGTILPGVTRDSVIHLAQHMGMDIREEKLDINNIIKDIKNNRIIEAFGCGTAAVISPISELIFHGERVTIKQGASVVGQRIKKALEDIQYGRSDDPFGWRLLLN
jgi:branched-chain amino acid aminotransferase